MTLNQWITRFLAKRALTKPDGRPLFAYKASHDEYLELGEKLRGLTETERTTTELRYAQAWLLFAAEWWKREYAGGAWSWATLCNAAGHDDTTQPVMQSLVTTGRRYWNLREEIKESGKRFIGFVVINGGIPMRLIETAQGGLTSLLQAVTEQAIKYTLSDKEIEESIKLRVKNELSQNYHQDHIYTLLTDLTIRTLRLCDTYNLHGIEDPIEALNQQFADWREDLPLAMDKEEANNLIKLLLCSAVQEKKPKQLALFKITRGLRFNSDGSDPTYELKFVITKKQASSAELKRELNIRTEIELPNNFQLFIRIATHEHFIAEAIKRGDDYILIERNPPVLQDIYESVQIIATRWGTTLQISTMQNGAALNTDEPLIFEDDLPFAQFVGQGDVSVKGSKALALIPPNTMINARRVEHEFTSIEDKQLVRITEEENIFLCATNQRFTVNLKAKNESGASTHWQGTILNVQSTPNLIFKGHPRLRVEREEQDQYEYAPSSEIYVHTPNKKEESKLSEVAAPGLCRLIWRKNGQRLLSTHAVILPQDADIKYIPGNTPYEGEIHLLKWRYLPVRCLTEGIEITSSFQEKESALILKLKCNKEKPPLHSITIGLQWPSANKEHRISLPFPSYGCIVIDKDQNQIANNELLAIDQLMGCRAILMSGNRAGKWSIHLTAKTSEKEQLKKIIDYSGAEEMRLAAMIPIIRQMIASYESLDTSIILEIFHGNERFVFIEIGHYSRKLSLNTKNSTVCIVDKNKSHQLALEKSKANGLLQAVYLAHPQDEIISLSIKETQQDEVSDWSSDSLVSHKGPWLIYASENTDAPLFIKPEIIYPESTPNTLMAQKFAKLNKKEPTELTKASSLSASNERIAKIRAVLRNMAANPNNEDWKTLECIIEKLRYLPLTSIDIYKALSHEHSALTMAILKDIELPSLSRFSSELPFEWLLISPKHWENALKKVAKDAQDCPRSQRALQRNIERVEKELSASQPALNFIFKQVSYMNINSKDPDLCSSFITHKLNELFGKSHNSDDRENTYLQKLIRNLHQEPDWLKQNSLTYSSFLNTVLGKKLLNRSRLPADDWKTPVVVLPFMVAFDVYEDRSSKWQNSPYLLFALRQARQLDREWFDEAYCVGLAMAQHHKKHSSGAQ